ncbi:galactose mutarotase [Enterococcus pallens ATCC BAA-351]|nr:galactose mutarotase [Enterococcus pallens ATCC BAA-351]OJG78621.1 galactose mutarotase [Enterococcus pallens]
MFRLKISKKDFGKGFHLITLENQQGMRLAVSDLGARIVSLSVPVADSRRELVLGFDSAEEYLAKDPFIGASIGRTAGRIENGIFELNGQTIQVDVDEATHHSLHGGQPGFESKKWTYTIIEGHNEASVLFNLISPTGEHGFPGTLDMEVRYTLTADNIWRITTRGISDQDTLFNPTNHVYFNLTGECTQAIDQHQLWLNSSQFAELRNDTIPTGQKLPVAGTAFDFTKKKALAELFASDFDQKQLADGMDHPFFLNQSDLAIPAATLTSPDEKVQLTVKTDASSVVLFTANFGDNTPEMHGQKMANHGGITFETQTAPGAEQFPSFGSIKLTAYQPFTTITEFIIEGNEE